MQCGQNVQLLNVKLLVHHVTGRLYKGHLHQQCSVKLVYSCGYNGTEVWTL